MLWHRVEREVKALAATARVIVTLACPDCRGRNYTTTKSKKNDPNRMELKKFCPRCHGYTLHRETR